MLHRKDCIFCQIARGTAPCHLIHEDPLCMSFMDINPVTPGHVLLIPRQHFSDIFSADPEAVSAVAASSVAIAAAIKEVVEFDGMGVHQLNGAAAGQTVFHYHTHLIPRKQGDDIAIHSRRPGDSAQLAQLATEIRQAFSSLQAKKA